MGGTKTPTFLKWAGGKRQLLHDIDTHLPSSFQAYYEPFLGSGAFFFHIKGRHPGLKATLFDSNEELINTFVMVRDRPKDIIAVLKTYKKKYTAKPKDHYYAMRAIDPQSITQVERAARFIFLNRTCFNGLYRVNSKGCFNVPMGRYTNPDIVQEENILRASALLQGAVIRHTDFSSVTKMARKGDVVYLDPPYYPIARTSFTSYHKEQFLDPEHNKLAKMFELLSRRGCICIESNSDTPFVRTLYSKYRIFEVQTKRLINANAKARGTITELIITNEAKQ